MSGTHREGRADKLVRGKTTTSWMPDDNLEDYLDGKELNKPLSMSREGC
jgi:hypothetical protein